MVTWSIGYGASALDLNQLNNLLQGNYVLSGCTPSDGTNAMEVDIASGTIQLDGSEISVNAQTVTLAASNADPRKDIIYIDSTGSATNVSGNPAPPEPDTEDRFHTYNPTPPDMSNTNGVVVAEIWVGGGVSDITGTDIRDRTAGSLLGESENVSGSWTFGSAVNIDTGGTGAALDLNQGDINNVDDVRFVGGSARIYTPNAAGETIEVIDQYNNADLGNWVNGVGLDMMQNQVKQLVIDKRSARPTSPAIGQIIYRTDKD